MSDNSVIYLIKKNLKRGQYAIIHADADSGTCYKTVWAKDAEEAILKAEEMQDETGAEYGVMIETGKK